MMRVRGRKDGAAAGRTSCAECLAHRATMLRPVCVAIIMARDRGGLVEIQMHSGG